MNMTVSNDYHSRSETSAPFEDWPLKWLSCLVLGAVCMLAAMVAILGIITEPCLAWRHRILMAFLLHPMHFVMGFVTLFFRLKLPGIVERAFCPRLVYVGVASQWGVTISTFVICLGMSLKLLLAVCPWPSPIACRQVSPTVLTLTYVMFILILHCLAWLVTLVSLPSGFGYRSGPSCAKFFSSAGAFPRTVMGWCIVTTALFALAISAVILANIRKKQRLQAIGAMQVRDMVTHHPLVRPPDEVGHNFIQGMANNAAPPLPPQPEDGHDVNANARAWGRGGKVNEDDTVDDGSRDRSVSMDDENLAQSNNERIPRLNQDFYDNERTRHYAQSPPPVPMNQAQRQLCEHSSVNLAQAPPSRPRNPANIPPQRRVGTEQAAPPRPVNLAQAPPLRLVNQPPVPPLNRYDINNNDDVARANNPNRFVLPDIYLEIVFPHRDTPKNKRRFSFTRVQHTREVSWDMNEPLGSEELQRIAHLNALDHLICISNLLYAMAYTPLACYLLYTSDDSSYRFTDQSFHPFVIIVLLKASLDSLFSFIGFQLFL